MSQVTETYYKNTTWRVPAGCKSVTVKTFKMNQNVTGMVSRYLTPSFGHVPMILDPYGRAFAAGGNGNGGLGVGDVAGKSIPTAVLGGFAWSFIQTGGVSLGINQAGVAMAWGVNLNGQLGLGDVVPRSSPVAVLGGFTFSSLMQTTLTGGVYLLTPSGKLYAQGINGNGQLGVGDVTPRSSPVAVLGTVTWQKLIQCSSQTLLGIDTANAAWGMGIQQSGELGCGDVIPRSSPVAVVGGFTWMDIASVNAGSVLGLATPTLASDGTLLGTPMAWGLNTNGQLGLGDVIPRSSPVAVLGGLAAKFIVQGAGSTFIIDSSNNAWACGANTDGQLGIGDVTPRSSPVAVLGGFKFRYILCDNSGNNSVFGLTTTGVAVAWGKNASGQLGVGDVIPRSSPVAVLGGKIFQEIWGNPAMFGVDLTGVVYSWGLNLSGQLMQGDTVPRSSPVALTSMAANWMPAVTESITIPTTPDSLVIITMNQFACYFGSNRIAQGYVDSVQLIYDNQ